MTVHGQQFGPERFDHFVLQGFFGGQSGWEDLTAGSSLDEIMCSWDDYRENAPLTPYRIRSVSNKGKRRMVRISKSHLHAKEQVTT